MEGKPGTGDPALHDPHVPAEVALHQMDEDPGILIRHAIKAVIAEHVEPLFGNMDDQFLDEFVGMLRLVDDPIIFMTLIPVGHAGTIIGCDAGLCHDRPADIPGDVSCDSHGGAELFF